MKRFAIGSAAASLLAATLLTAGLSASAVRNYEHSLYGD